MVNIHLFCVGKLKEKHFAAACEVFAQVQLDRRFKTLDFYKSMKIDN